MHLKSSIIVLTTFFFASLISFSDDLKWNALVANNGLYRECRKLARPRALSAQQRKFSSLPCHLFFFWRGNSPQQRVRVKNRAFLVQRHVIMNQNIRFRVTLDQQLNMQECGTSARKYGQKTI